MRKLITSGKYHFRGKYYADSNGHIWSEYKQDYLVEQEDKNGYKKVVLMTTDKPLGKGHRFSVHRLILEAFQPTEDKWKLQVDHIDGDISNNTLENLRWTTPQENLNNENTKPNRRCYDQEGLNNSSSKFTKETLQSLIEDANSGKFKRKELLVKYEICDETLRKILLRKSYQQETSNLIIAPNFISDYARESSKGENNGRAKLNEKQVKEIIELLKQNQFSSQELAKRYGVSNNTILNIKANRTWKHLPR